MDNDGSLITGLDCDGEHGCCVCVYALYACHVVDGGARIREGGAVTMKPNG